MSRPFREKVTINPLQWATPRIDPSDRHSARAWLVAEPGYRDVYPAVLGHVRDAGFESVMMDVLPSQTLQDYARMVDAAGLGLAPGYAAVDVPDSLPARGSAQRIRWFDGVRRKAEESAYFGLSSIFLAPMMSFREGSVRTLEAAAVGAGFDADRLERMTEVIGEAADVLAAEGIRAGLHNHVGTWVETVSEMDHVLSVIDPSRLGASIDIGHLAWLGIDPAEVVRRHADRIIDLHVKDMDLALARRSREERRPYSWAPARGLFREPGAGDLDLEGILDALPGGFDGWIVIEVDSTDMDPVDSVRACAAWAEATFLPRLPTTHRL